MSRDELPDGPKTGSSQGRFAAGTPEDVAALYTWANIQGARYRDFSGSRVRHREQVRARAAEALRERAKGGAEEELVEAARAAFAESDSWLNDDSGETAEELGAATDQTPAVPLSFREELELRLRRAPQREETQASFDTTGQVKVERDWAESRAGLQRDSRSARIPYAPPERGQAELPAADLWERVEDGPAPPLAAEMQRGSVAPLAVDAEAPGGRPGSGSTRAWDESREALFDSEAGAQEEYAGPAWLYGRENAVRRSRAVPAARGLLVQEPAEETRTRSGRWAALRGVVEEGRGELRAAQLGPAGERRAPLLVVLSLAGGVGKTSLVATLGRVLSASGERVALGDTAAYSLLPFYFGARDVRPGAKRMFAPPEGSDDAPILMANYDLAGRARGLQEQRQIVAEVLRNGADCNRILLDVPADAEWLVRRMATLGATVVVPLTPDMNSVVGLEAVERYFERMVDSEGEPVLPFYLLNQFDGAMALHLDVREVLRRRLGDRLLSFVVRRSAAVSEALAEGMTVVDYAPESPVARDYFDLASWLRMVSPPAMAGMRNLRGGGR